MAATAKASPSCRRAGHPSQRRPWTTDEENALMAGLDRVKGPHWSQILAMFGPGGTINETLKDRNQVQLKDKARNLKLFFLKSNIEVPYYLSFVTGELKTRAPAQAAKNEAKQKERVSEDRAHMEGMMTLPWHSAQDGEHAVDPENGVEEGCIRNVIDSETEERANGTQTEFERREGTLEVMNNEPSIDNIGSIQQRYHRASSNPHVNGDLIYQNKALENLLAEASHAGLNEVTKIENLVA